VDWVGIITSAFCDANASVQPSSCEYSMYARVVQSFMLFYLTRAFYAQCINRIARVTRCAYHPGWSDTRVAHVTTIRSRRVASTPTHHTRSMVRMPGVPYSFE